MSELRACPFCGGEVKLYREPYQGGQQAGINPIGLLCPGCKTTHLFDAHESQVMLKKHWNTRPIEDSLRARVAELEGSLARATEAAYDYDSKRAALGKIGGE